ncbi:unnamed protein product [Durusdinium trenchii]|uniref:Uncharacterized protein n=2 Tax=Durusdinium trenchii TaxID=1381693 RepID=A0ABP0IFX4_9DINO
MWPWLATAWVLLAWTTCRCRHSIGRECAVPALPLRPRPLRRGLATRQLFSESVFTRRSKRSLSTWYGQPVIPDSDVKAYVDLVLSDPNSQVNDPAVPDFIEREVYFVVVRFVLQMLHFAVGVIDERALFGQTLYMLQYQSKEHKQLQRASLNLTPDMIDFAMREVVTPSSQNMRIVSKLADKILYKNAVKFALRLVIDMVSSVELSGCGLRVSVQIEADPSSAKKSLQQYPLNLGPFEKSCEPLVKELMAQRTIPLPQKLQKALYKNLLRVLALSAAAALQSSKLDVFGISVDPRFGR